MAKRISKVIEADSSSEFSTMTDHQLEEYVAGFSCDCDPFIHTCNREELEAEFLRRRNG